MVSLSIIYAPISSYTYEVQRRREDFNSVRVFKYIYGDRTTHERCLAWSMYPLRKVCNTAAIWTKIYIYQTGAKEMLIVFLPLPKNHNLT